MKRGRNVLVTVPVYNEEEQIEQKISDLYKYSKKNLINYNYKIVIAENGSKDKTVELGKALAKKLDTVSFYKHPVQGRGKALYKLWQITDADCYVYMDVDLATDIQHTHELIHSILEKNYDLSLGSRNLKRSRVQRSLKRTIFSKGYISLLKLVFQIKTSDTQCGFKGIGKNAKNLLWPLMDPTNWTGAAWFFDAELIILAEKLGLKIYEIPVKWKEAPDTTVAISGTINEDLNGILRILRTKPWKRSNKKQKD